jgi:aspartate beta-hydroxylase
LTERPPVTLAGIMVDAEGALERRDYAAAQALFEQVVTISPLDSSAWYGLACAARGLGDERRRATAVDRALTADPAHLPSLLMKADFFAAVGDGRAAETFYSAVVSRAPPLETLSPDMREAVRRATRESARLGRTFEQHLEAALQAAGFDPARSSRRFVQSLDLMFGRKSLYHQAPTSFYFAELPQRQFYERDEFPWLAALEARTDDIREELLGLLSDEGAFRPYVQAFGNRPPVEYGRLLDSPDWSAFYLIEGGTVAPQAAERCPATLAALHCAPLARAPGRTPSVLFSLLRPGVRIPPHNGQINARLICHLPLIVPEGCGIRVGNEVRSWAEGETTIFDDTIEHEAWNNSGRFRVVLLFEIWRPELSVEERGLVAAMLSAVALYGDGALQSAG